MPILVNRLLLVLIPLRLYVGILEWQRFSVQLKYQFSA